VVVGTVGEGVPEEVLVAAGVEVVAVAGAPGEPTELAERFVEPMVGERARSQLQRLLDGSYGRLDLLLFSREEDALLRLFYTVREIRRLEPARGLPPARLVDLQQLATPATRRWNRERIRALCSLLRVEDDALPPAIAKCNSRRRRTASPAAGRRRVYVTGSPYRETALPDAVDAAGGAIVEGPPVLTDEDGDPVDAIARRYEHPLVARAAASSAARAAATAEDAVDSGADVVLAFYLEGDDGLRWEYPEQREALAAAGLPVLLLDHQPYDLRGLVLDV
jgi:hypothetical protein